MKIYPPVCLNERGNRSNNEDTVFPEQPLEKDSLFMVCDGVGGQDRGEVASQLVCTYFSEYFSKNQQEIDENHKLGSGLQYVENKLKDYVGSKPECSEMASTLVLVYLLRKENKALIGWVGDSRVYHIRNGKILFQTKDHSEVQSLLDMGEITEKEVENHPRKNVITRAINGRNPTRIDQKIIEDIKPDDFFLVCSDGILENLDKERIHEWFFKENQPEEIKSLVLHNALNKTKDNFSMYLIKVKSVEEIREQKVPFYLQRGRITGFIILIIILILVLMKLVL
ncbi:MAG: serine/threonine-protein phosphatase [Flavobacteriaceae bacterium]|jgi:protein phosphatase|nr:serine/threonine-protein phosphatase [Flavobacteriaceae bacterium]